MVKVHIVDGEAKRRGQLCRLFASRSFHSEPFDSVKELLEFRPLHGCVFVHDVADHIEKLLHGLRQNVWLPVIGYGNGTETCRIVRAMQEGAVSYLPLPLQVDEFLNEYERLERISGQQFARNQRSTQARLKLEKLSEREREILRCLLDHGTSKVIARHLKISPRTVEAHRANIMTKLKVRTVAQAIQIAVEGDVLEANFPSSVTRVESATSHVGSAMHGGWSGTWKELAAA